MAKETIDNAIAWFEVLYRGCESSKHRQYLQMAIDALREKRDRDARY